MNYKTVRINGLEIEMKFTGIDEDDDLTYWTRLCDIKSISRQELNSIINKIEKIIYEHYLRDRLSDIEDTIISNRSLLPVSLPISSSTPTSQDNKNGDNDDMDVLE